MRGLDADTCRAIAAAVLGDATKVKHVATSTQNRFTALQSGEIDLLAHSTTWTLVREANLGLEFAWVNYYDGTGFLVKKSAGVMSAKEMDGATVCVEPGTSTELAVNDYFRLNNIKFTPILIANSPEYRLRSYPDDVTPIHRMHLHWQRSGSARDRRPTTSCSCRTSSARSRWA